MIVKNSPELKKEEKEKKEKKEKRVVDLFGLVGQVNCFFKTAAVAADGESALLLGETWFPYLFDSWGKLPDLALPGGRLYERVKMLLEEDQAAKLKNNNINIVKSENNSINIVKS